MYPRLRTTVVAPSDRRDDRDRVDRVDPEELDGVEVERSKYGTAPSAIDGDTLGDGELGRCSGEVTLLAGLVEGVSAIAI